MDDFLHNLRSGKLKQGERAGRREFTDYKGPQRRTGNDRRRPDYYAKVTQENFALVKDSLDAMADQQKRIAEALEAIAAALGAQPAAVPTASRPPAAAPAPPAHMPLEDDLYDGDDEMDDQVDDEGDDEETDWGAKLEEEDWPRVAQLMGELRDEGQSWEKIARYLIDEGVPTLTGKGLWRGPAVKKFWETHS